MVQVRVEEKEAFTVCGKKCYISGQDNEQFEKFWSDSHADGTVEKLKAASSSPETNVTRSLIFGVSRVEKDPNNRAFDFYIGSECEKIEGFEAFTVSGGKWAIFRNTGENIGKALFEAEIYAVMDWLPKSEYVHAFMPELEVYPADDSNVVEFWLPISEK